MYVLVRSRYRLDRRAGRWLTTDLSNEPVATLATRFGDVYLYIEYPGAGEVLLKALHWEKVANEVVGVSPVMTVQQWLDSVGNRTLPFEDKLPNEELRLVKYAQAWHAGYNVKPQGRSGHIDSNESKFEKDDLIITHPKFKPQVMREYSMHSVNGYFHLTDYTDAGVRIIDGNKTVRKVNDNQIGVYSFETIGKLKYVPITDEMINPTAPGNPLWNNTYLTMPADIDIKDKTVLFVSGGYLNVLSNVYERTGERTWRIHFGNMMFLDRFIQSVTQLDLSSLGLTYDERDPTLMSVEKMKSDETVRAYLKLSQTFFVVVDSASFFQEFKPVEMLKSVGRFIDVQYDRMPLIGAYGKMLDYHTILEPGKKNIKEKIQQFYVYCSVENYRYNYTANQVDWTKQAQVDGGCYPAHPKRSETAFYRILGVEG